MKISDLLRAPLIFPRLESGTKRALIHELAIQIAEVSGSLSAVEVERALLQREALGSTGTEAGCAFPHARLAGLTQPLLAFGHSVQGIPFGAVDEQDSDLFFVLLAPATDSTQLPLDVLAALSRLLRMASLRAQLRAATSPTEVVSIFRHTELG